MASEDSRKREGFRKFIVAAIVAYAPQALHPQVPATLHHADDLRELHELGSLAGSQWILFEERKDAARQILKGPD